MSSTTANARPATFTLLIYTRFIIFNPIATKSRYIEGLFARECIGRAGNRGGAAIVAGSTQLE